MKKNGALIWGILILLAAAGLLCYAFMPNLAVFTVPLWKWFAAAALLYWMIRLIFFGKKLAKRLSFVFPLALLFLVFEREIGTLAGKGPNFVNNWIIILAAGLLTAAFHLIFRDKPLVRPRGQRIPRARAAFRARATAPTLTPARAPFPWATTFATLTPSSRTPQSRTAWVSSASTTRTPTWAILRSR